MGAGQRPGQPAPERPTRDHHHHRRRRETAVADGGLHRGDAGRLPRFRRRRRRQPAAHALSRAASRSRAQVPRQCPCRRGSLLRHRLRAGRIADHQAAKRHRRPAALRKPEGLQLGHRHPLQHRDRRAAGADARVPTVGHARRRHHRRRGRCDRATGRGDARPVRHRQAGARGAGSDRLRAADQAGERLQPERRASRGVRARHGARRHATWSRSPTPRPRSPAPTSCAAPPPR